MVTTTLARVEVPGNIDAMQKTLSERKLKHFIKNAWHIVEPATPFMSNWHIDAICDHLEAVEAGEIKNLLVTMPPRMMKSLTISVFYPAWRWIDRPDIRFLYASYSQDLATLHSVATRRIILSNWYQERWGDRFTLAEDANLKTRFENDKRGSRFSTSVGGVVTGVGGDRIVVDDPLNVRDAESEASRNSAIRWWNEAMSTRFNNPMTGARIVVMQRIHVEDLAGHLLEQGGYVHLNLPMEYEPGNVHYTGWGNPDPRREPNELLAPDRVGPDEVADLKQSLGSRAYAGQYQQRPAPAEGAIFKRHWWRFWHYSNSPLDDVVVHLPDGREMTCPCEPLPDEFDDQIQSWDMTFKDTKDSDYVCGQIWGSKDANSYLLDQALGRLDFPATLRVFQDMTIRWPEATYKLVEDKANGPAVIATLRTKIGGIIPVNPKGGKNSRANATVPFVESGNYYLPHPSLAPWVRNYVEEFAMFPTGKHDDQVDATSQAHVKLEELRQGKMEAPQNVGGTGVFLGDAINEEWGEDPWA